MAVGVVRRRRRRASASIAARAAALARRAERLGQLVGRAPAPAGSSPGSSAVRQRAAAPGASSTARRGSSRCARQNGVKTVIRLAGLRARHARRRRSSRRRAGAPRRRRPRSASVTARSRRRANGDTSLVHSTASAPSSRASARHDVLGPPVPDDERRAALAQRGVERPRRQPRRNALRGPLAKRPLQSAARRRRTAGRRGRARAPRRRAPGGRARAGRGAARRSRSWPSSIGTAQLVLSDDARPHRARLPALPAGARRAARARSCRCTSSRSATGR